ncbi:MAG: hypothetical protein K9J76_06875 [Polaromonas sp.]|nr:hypothetical protein [Polaromonas sp.]
MTHPPSQHRHEHGIPHGHADHPEATSPRRPSVLAWPAWRRVLAVLPLVLALWLAVWWAHMGASPW